MKHKKKEATADNTQLSLANGISPAAPAIPPAPSQNTMSIGADDIPNRELGDDQEFFIPVHDFVRFTEDEIRIIDHPAFQRLGKVYQLGQSYITYRGATHKRMEHVLGTVWIAQKIANALQASYQRSKKKGLRDRTSCDYADPLSLTEIRFVRLAALLHDIGHLPAGHTLEDELGLLEPHDADKRLNLVFGKRDWIPGVDSVPLGELIDNTYQKYVSDGGTERAQAIVKKLISKDLENEDALVAGIRVGICRDIVGNTICADLLDYLHRDWYHIGKPRFFDKRLFEYMEIRRDSRDRSQHLVMSYGQRGRPKRDAISQILELLESRYTLGEAVLFHPAKCAAAAMLERAIGELYSVVPSNEQETWLGELENRLLAYSDEEMLAAILNECEQRECNAGLLLIRSLMGREIYKSVEVVYGDDLSDAQQQMIEHHYLGHPVDNRRDGSSKSPKIDIKEKRQAAQLRVKALASFEREFQLDPGSIVMYCPARSMNSKIAQVKVIHNDAINTLDVWDKKKNPKLAGGHCAAQIERFASLWRVEVFIRKSALEKLQSGNNTHSDHFSIFQRAVRALILGVTTGYNTLAEEAFEIVSALAKVEESNYYRRKSMQVVAARDQRAADMYPLGAPFLQTLLIPDE